MEQAKRKQIIRSLVFSTILLLLLAAVPLGLQAVSKHSFAPYSTAATSVNLFLEAYDPFIYVWPVLFGFVELVPKLKWKGTAGLAAGMTFMAMATCKQARMGLHLSVRYDQTLAKEHQRWAGYDLSKLTPVEGKSIKKLLDAQYPHVDTQFAELLSQGILLLTVLIIIGFISYCLWIQWRKYKQCNVD